MERINLAFTIGLVCVAVMVVAACGYIVCRKIQLKRFDATFSFAVGMFLWATGTALSYSLGVRYRYCQYMEINSCHGLLTSGWVPVFVGTIMVGGLWHLQSLTSVFNEKLWIYAGAATLSLMAISYYMLG